MAGQSVGLVSREQSTAQILDELVGQALAAIAGRERRDSNPFSVDSATGRNADG
jgi:enoyl-[acyl-carrier protein] reductase II